jgi:predicted nucleic acid-binding protein
MVALPFEHSVLVLDTSVIVKWFRQGELLADRALVLRDAYLDGQIVIAVPSLVAYELANVLHYKGDLSTDQVQEAVGSVFDMELEWVPPSSEVMRRAVEISRSYETTVYDAAFVALCESLEATFITADEKLAHSLESLTFVRFLGDISATPSTRWTGRIDQ